MKHFVLMRWNLPGAIHYATLERVLDPEWQERRRQIFQTYCLPSVVRQSARDFIWLFLVHRSITPDKEVAWFREQDRRLRVVLVDDDQSSGAPEAREAISQLVGRSDWIITTRLDSDDVLHPDHLRRVREIEHDRQRKVIEFSQGYYYDVLRDELRYVEERHNAFVSVIEPATDLRTAWGWHHHEIEVENEVHYLDEPGWIALVHDQNTTTRLWGDRVPSTEHAAVLAEFCIERPSFVSSRVHRLRSALLVRVRRR